MRFLPFVAFALSTVLGCSTPPSKDPSNNGEPANNQNASTNASTNGATNGSSGPIIHPDDYDQTCQWDSDCDLVRGGDVCGCGMICPAAIASTALDEFNSDVEAVDCTNVTPGPCPGAACQQMIPVCSSGDCEAIPKLNVTPGQFDQTCDVAEDCMLINSGEICSACDCDRAAINVADADAYQDLVGDIDCNPGPNTCNCEPPNEVVCDEGMCKAQFGM